MSATDVTASALTVLDAALTRWEWHGRPGLPDRGFTLGRQPGRRRRGIYRAATGAPVFEHPWHITRMAPAPDGRHIAVQLAERADEDAAFGLVEVTSGRLRLFPHLRCRYDPVLWDSGSRTVELVAGRSHRLVTVDVVSGRLTTTDVPADVRTRLFPGASRGLLARSRAGSPTQLLDRATGAEIAAFPAVVRVLPLGTGVLVDDGTHLRALDPRTGGETWAWRDRSLRVTDVATDRLQVLVAGVRAGRSVLVRLVEGEPVDDRPVVHGGEPLTASGVGADGGRFHVLVEGPSRPPEVVAADELTRAGPAGPVPATTGARSPRTAWHTVTADDGASVQVAITSPADADGPAPMILTCYGGFGVPSLPVFEPTIPAWIEHGGRYATAQVRGGGEHGAAWREAGRGANKHRGIDDLACVARGLVAAGLTRPDLLVLVGASHGGVLVTACALGAPQLCAGVVATAAPLDLLDLDAHPGGHRWVTEFGAPDSPDGVQRLRAISPLHRARALPPGTAVPRFLGITLEEDSRVAAEDTRAVVEVLRGIGGDATHWRAEHTGHGGNHLESLHRLGSTVLGFAAAATGTADGTAPTTPST